MTASDTETRGEERTSGLVTIVFTDVESSTELTTTHGDQAARALLRDHEDLVRRAVAGNGGRELKSLGDGFMLAFNAPRRAIACAVDIQRSLQRMEHAQTPAGVRVRIGINTGEVIEENGDVFGEAVHAAARIAAKADGGAVLVADVVRQLAGTVPGVRFTDRGRYRLRGFPERCRLWEVTWEQEVAPSPAALPERSPLVGRDTERARLGALLERAVAGHGGLIVVGGEPGIGKTRLVQEVADDAVSRGALVLIGRCYESESPLPYLPFVEIVEAALDTRPRDEIREALGDAGGEIARIVPRLRRAFPDLPPPLELPAEHERRLLFDAVRDFLVRAAVVRGPLMLVIDDVQWADAATLLLVEHVVERLSALPVLIAATYRDVELEVGRPLAATLESLLRRRLVERITLRRLNVDGVAAMLHALSRREPPPYVVRAIFTETEGNPFFVEEVYRHLVEEGRLLDSSGEWRTDLHISEMDVPQSVRLVIGRRLERLGDMTRRVLASGATVSRPFDLVLLGTVAGVDEDTTLDAVDEAERAGIVIAHGEGAKVAFGFTHELIRQTLLSELSTVRRQRLHLRVAEALEAGWGDAAAEHAAELARHFHDSGLAADPMRTVGYLRLAAEQALDAAAFEDALRHVETALELVPETESLTHARLLEVLGLALRSIGRWSEATQRWDQALTVYEAAGRREDAGRLCAMICAELQWAGRQTEALEYVSRGLSALENVQDSIDRAHLLAQSANAFTFVGNYEIGDSLFSEALQIAERVGDRRARAEVRSWVAFHRWFWLQINDAFEMAQSAADVLREEGAWWLACNALTISVITSMMNPRLGAAEPLARDALALAQRIGHVGLENTTQRMLAIRFLGRGDQQTIAEHAAREHETAASTGWRWMFDAHVVDGVGAMAAGDWEGALAKFQRGDELEIPCAFARTPWGFMLLTTALLGDRTGVATLWEAGRGRIPSGAPMQLGAAVALACAAEALCITGMWDTAAPLHAELVGIARDGLTTRGYDYRLQATVRALTAAAGRRWEEAEALFESARREAEQMDNRLDAADSRRLYAMALLDLDGPGGRIRARELLEDARSRYTSLDMPRHASLTEDLLPR